MAYSLTCAECGHDFIASRANAETCSPACRLRRFRAAERSRRERELRDVERAARLLARLAAEKA